MDGNVCVYGLVYVYKYGCCYSRGDTRDSWRTVRDHVLYDTGHISWYAGISDLLQVREHKGGTALFALLALAGDVGCAAGPTAVGAVSDAFGGDIRLGIACGLAVPLLMLVALFFYRERGKGEPKPLHGSL